MARRWSNTLGVAVAFAAMLVAGCATATVDRSSPVVTARGFYEFHLNHDMGFTPANVAERSRWLSPDLDGRFQNYFARPTSPDVVPDIDGDPFTDSQEYPNAFRIEYPEKSESSTIVPVRLWGPETEPRTVRLVLVSRNGEWMIDDMEYEDGRTLRTLLDGHP